MRKKICVITGSRADYGLLRWVIQGIFDSDVLKLQIIATGSHLSPEFGLTYRDIESDGYLIDRKVEMLLSSDTSVGVAKSLGLGLIGFADALNELGPAMIVVLGDRFEIFGAVSAALFARVPVAHLHGGETTLGAFDESLRHSITKMSHLHFVAAEEYRRRVIQMGENPENVFMVGGFGIDNIRNLKLLDRESVESLLGFSLNEKNLLITFHPVTLDSHTAADQMGELLEALARLNDTRLIFTFPNADTDSRVLIEMAEQFVTTHSNSCLKSTLGQLLYLSCIAHVDGVVGNSSSGLLEVPSFSKGTINIGDRQSGRLKATSVIDCEPNMQSISDAIDILYSAEFMASLNEVVNPYGEGGGSARVVDMLEQQDVVYSLKKTFYDLPFLAQTE